MVKVFKHGGFSRPGEHYTKPKRWGYVEIGRDGVTYLRRWYLWRCKWFSVRLHHFVGPDPDQDMHDHPWNFWSFPLVGSYYERNEQGTRHVRWLSRHKSTDLHSVLGFERENGVWTLFVTGEETRGWGFQTPDGWKSYQEYLGIA